MRQLTMKLTSVEHNGRTWYFKPALELQQELLAAIVCKEG